jgi:O-antigen ligase
LAISINAIIILFETPTYTPKGELFGYRGYFTFKGYLGECASIAILLSIYVLRFAGWRRICALFLILTSLLLIFLSGSKGSLAFAVVSPVFAGIIILTCKYSRVPYGVVLTIIVGSFFLLSFAKSNLINNLSYRFYGDGTLTGRTVIWDFVESQMWRNPWFGLGFKSFWLVGSDSPSATLAPEWVGHMTGSHSGYLDVKLETGRIGFAIFVIFIFAALYGIGRVIREDPFRGWMLLSLAVYIVITNFLETAWVSNDPLWVVFIFVVADATCYPKRAVGRELLQKCGPSRSVVRPGRF